MTGRTIEGVRAAWLSECPHDARQKLHREAVLEIIWRLIAAGVQPTVASVKAVHGSGSPNVIQPAIKAFFEDGELQRRTQAPPPATDVPEPVQRLWRDAITEARLAVDAEYQVRRERIGVETAALAERERDLDAARDAHAQAVEDQKAERTALRRRVAGAERARRDAERTRDKEAQRAQRAEAQVAPFERVSAALDAAEHRVAMLAQERDALTATVARADADAQAERTAHAAARDAAARLTAHVDTLTTEHVAAARQVEQLQGLLRTASAELDAARRAAATEASHCKESIRALEQRCTEADTRIAAFQTEAAQAREDARIARMDAAERERRHLRATAALCDSMDALADRLDVLEAIDTMPDAVHSITAQMRAATALARP